MSPCVTALFLFLAMATTTSSCYKQMEVLHIAQIQVSQAKSYIDNMRILHYGDLDQTSVVALRDCVKLYEESQSRLSHMMANDTVYTTQDDALTWVSAVMTNHRTCLDGLKNKEGLEEAQVLDRNLTLTLRKALLLYAIGTEDKAKGMS